MSGSSDWETGQRKRQSPPPGRLAPLPIAPDPHQYSLSDLERETGIPGRTVRYYIAQGLLPPAKGRGPSATYDLSHLMRLRMIQILKDQHFPLLEIRERLATLSDEDIAGLLDVQLDPPEDVWRRISLHPDIELLARQPSRRDPELEEAIDLIVGLARPVIERMESES